MPIQMTVEWKMKFTGAGIDRIHPFRAFDPCGMESYKVWASLVRWLMVVLVWNGIVVFAVKRVHRSTNQMGSTTTPVEFRRSTNMSMIMRLDMVLDVELEYKWMVIVAINTSCKALVVVKVWRTL